MKLIWLIYNALRIVVAVAAFYERERLIEDGAIDPYDDPPEFLKVLRGHD